MPEVRLSLVEQLPIIHKTLGPETLSQSILPVLLELAEDSKWRVRNEVIKFLPKLILQLGVD